MDETTTETTAPAEPEGLDEFLAAYIEAALWSSTDDDGQPLDKSYGMDDNAPDTLARMRADCTTFLAHPLGGQLIAIAERLEAEGKWSLPSGAHCSVMEYAGHDFWLTRNSHGCGFWDGDWPKGIGEGLDRLSKGFGTYDLFVGEDNRIYGA